MVFIYYYWIALLQVSFLFSIAFNADALNNQPLSPIADFSHQRLALATEQDEQLEYDFYRSSCPNAEIILHQVIRESVANDSKIVAQLLRLMFHDCFIQGCDASLLLDDSHGNQNHPIERNAIPNRTVKGFEIIDRIKEALEKECPNVVSCSDIISLATRDGIILTGGPFFPVLTGRRDSQISYFNDAIQEIPRPDGNISETLRLFAERGFDEKETVTLLGAHNIGQIGCNLILQRLSDFKGTGKPDPSVSPDFALELIRSCNTSISPSPSISRLRTLVESTAGLSYYQTLASSIPSGSGFDTHYFKSLVMGRGLLYADQQLMADATTAWLVTVFASDDGSTFKWEFAKAMLKLSSLRPLTGSQGEVRTTCSLPNSH